MYIYVYMYVYTCVYVCRLATPSGLTSIPAGMETPDMIQLRLVNILIIYVLCTGYSHFSFFTCNLGRRKLKKQWSLGKLY